LKEKNTRKTIVAVTVIGLCVIITAVLLAVNSNNPLIVDQGSLYVADYTPCTYSDNSTYGNIVLVNPTSKTYSNLTVTIQVDGSEQIKPTLRLWTINASLKYPNSSLESAYYTMNSSSIQVETVSIGSNQTATIDLNFPSTATFRFSPHNLTVYISQDSLGDLVNGQLLTIPQTGVYLQIVGFSPVHYDNDTHHIYYNETSNDDYVYINDNPNFLQRYHNRTWRIGTANYALAANMDVLGEFYFNVTVHNNNTFAVSGVVLFGQIPSREYHIVDWGRALPDYVLQPGETYMFPVGKQELPIDGYVTGYITNSTLRTANQTAAP
jgi:hypothetical protein